MASVKIKDRVIDLVFYTAVVIFVLALGGTWLAKSLGQDLYFLGFKPFFISSESMAPEFLVHSLVLIKKSPYAQAQVGDIIAFKPEILGGRFALHRVIEKNETGLITKGDNNEIADLLPVREEEFVGQYVGHTNATAYLSQKIKQHGFWQVVGLPAVVVVIALVAARLAVAAVFGEAKDEEKKTIKASLEPKGRE